MRLLLTLEGPTPGSTRRALGALPHDAVHVLAVEPNSEELETIRELVERAGARFRVDPVPEGSLMEAFERVVDAIDADRERAARIEVQVNAGPDANVLSAAALLACLHEGVPAHFVHEKGHTPLPVFTRAPLQKLLGEDEQAALAGFPEQGIELTAVGEHDTAALNALKDRGLIEREGDRLVATGQGRAYREHLGRREAEPEA